MIELLHPYNPSNIDKNIDQSRKMLNIFYLEKRSTSESFWIPLIKSWNIEFHLAAWSNLPRRVAQ